MQRAIIEFIRVIAPSTCFIILISLLFSALLVLHDYFSLFQTLLFFPFLYLGCGLAAALFTIAAKWLLVGRYRPGEKPLWSTFVWRNELLNALHEHLAEPFLVGALTGTPFLPWYFRLLGARIGRRVYLETTDFSEFDLATVGDEAALNADCTIQTHLFEDRVMKMSTIEIGPRSAYLRFLRAERRRSDRPGARAREGVRERGGVRAGSPRASARSPIDPRQHGGEECAKADRHRRVHDHARQHEAARDGRATASGSREVPAIAGAMHAWAGACIRA